MVSVVRQDMLSALRYAGMLRRYRRQVRDRVRAEPALHLLPGLLDLPLAYAENLSLFDLLTTTPLLALRGSAGSGRSLAFMQAAWQWVIRQHADPLVLLALNQVDDVSQPPWMLLQHQLTLTDPGRPDEPSGAIRENTSGLVLVDGWEMLSRERQAVWRDCLLSLPRLWPELHIGVIVPETETSATWPAFRFVTLLPPDEAMLRQWVVHLLPDCTIDPLLNALRPGADQVIALPRLVHVALCCLLYAAGHLPTSPGHMYNYAQLALERYSAGQRKPSATTRLPHDDAAFMIGAAAQHWYRLARDIATHGNLDQLAVLSLEERSEVALLLVSMLPDPQPLYQTLWGGDPQHPLDALALGRCLVLNPPDEAVWSLRVLAALATLCDSVPAAREPGDTLVYARHMQRQLQRQFAPHLSRLLAEQGHILPVEEVGRLLVQLAPLLGATRLLELLDNPAIPAPVRWVSTSALRQMPPGVIWRTAQFLHPPDDLARIARCYLLACDDNAARQSLGREPFIDWIRSLEQADIDIHWRMQVIGTLFDQPQIPVTAQMIVLKNVPDIEDKAVWRVLLQACLSDDAADRQMVLGMLRSYAPARVLLLLGKILFTEKINWEVQQDVLEYLITYTQGEAVILLARCVIVPHLPLAARLRAMERLAQRRAGSAALFRRLLLSPTMHPAIRARAARLLGQQCNAEILPELAQVATSAAPVLVRREAIAAMADLARAPALAAAARIQLEALIEQISDVPELLIRTVQALGNVGTGESITRLGTLLADAPSINLRRAWLSTIPHLAQIPVDQWTATELPPTIRMALITTLAQSITSADHPGNLDDLLMRIAERVHCAAAAALCRIGRREKGASQQRVAAMFFKTLGQRRGIPGTGTVAVLQSLADLYDNGILAVLDQILDETSVDPQVCWLAIDQFGRESAVAAHLLRYLERNQTNAFLSSNIVRVLAETPVPGDLAIFSRLIAQPEQPLHLRIQAVYTLGKAGSTASETTLLGILADESMPLAVRAAAGAALPILPMAATRARLYDILEHERFPADVTAAIIGALGRMHDKEALPLLLRYARQDNPTVAVAALQALCMPGEAYVSAELVELTQRTSIDQRVRLQAVGTLLYLCGTEYIQLLRPYLNSPIVPLRLHAFELLLETCPHDADLVTIIADANLPLVIRLRAVEAAAQLLDNRLLAELLLEHALDAEVGIQVALILGKRTSPDVIDILARCVSSGKAVLRIRYYCIKLLAAHFQQTEALASRAGLALSRIADDMAQPEEQRMWAMTAFFTNNQSDGEEQQ